MILGIGFLPVSLVHVYELYTSTVELYIAIQHNMSVCIHLNIAPHRFNLDSILRVHIDLFGTRFKSTEKKKNFL